MSLMTKNPKTYEELAVIPVPETSGWHKPVKYTDHIDMVKESYRRMYGVECEREAYGTNKEGTQVFGVLDFVLDSENGEYTYSHVLRNSYNKSISIQNGGGGRVFICDNMMMVADAIVTARKNTLYAFNDVRNQISAVAAAARANLEALEADTKKFKSLPLAQVRGYHLLGEMLGKKIISPTVANVAFRDWNTPRHEEFADHNAWSLYNGVTEGLKLVSGSNRMSQQTGAHRFFQELVAA